MSRYAETVSEIRKFNRFYTVSMGFLDSGYLDTVYSIVETRSLFEIRMQYGKYASLALINMFRRKAVYSLKQQMKAYSAYLRKIWRWLM